MPALQVQPDYLHEALPLGALVCRMQDEKVMIYIMEEFVKFLNIMSINIDF